MTLVIGIVEDMQGLPVPNALVTVESGTESFPDIAIYSDTEGQFQIHLPEGRFRLAAHSPDGGKGTVEYYSDTSDHLLIRIGGNP
ncbi:MAG: carboxypeptidase-like regulatory domain-containing protein [Heteroscytonema crispum UTEX LB 1556]